MKYQLEPGEYHESDGWYFKRLTNGDVRIRIVDWPEGRIVREHIVAWGPWCSLIASVSIRGETSATWPLANEFHGRAR